MVNGTIENDCQLSPIIEMFIDLVDSKFYKAQLTALVGKMVL